MIMKTLCFALQAAILMQLVSLASSLETDFLNEVGTYDTEFPDITTLQDGRFMQVWKAGSSKDGSGGGVFAQLFNLDGTFNTS